MDHLRRAAESLSSAERAANDFSDNAAEHASLATAHAVLALIDIIQGDREGEINDAYTRIINLEAENYGLKQRVRELADQLDSCNDTLRKHEQAAANEKAATNNDLRKSYE